MSFCNLIKTGKDAYQEELETGIVKNVLSKI